MNKDPLEKDIEKKVCDYAKSKGFLVYKFTSPSQRSVPDRILINPHGFTIYVEFKRGGKGPTEAQEVEINKLKGNKAPVYVIDSVEKGKSLIDHSI